MTCNNRIFDMASCYKYNMIHCRKFGIERTPWLENVDAIIIVPYAEELWRIPRHRKQCPQRCVRYAERSLRPAVPICATRPRLILNRHRLLCRSDNPGMKAIHCSCAQIKF